MCKVFLQDTAHFFARNPAPRQFAGMMPARRRASQFPPFVRRKIGSFLSIAFTVIAISVAQPPAHAAGLVTLYSFCANFTPPICLDGATPISRLIEAGGVFYGTTSSGGKYQHGTLYEVSSSGGFKSLYSFCHDNYCADGSEPGSYLALGGNGAIYGVTIIGGKSRAGTIFKLSAGRLSTIYRFCSEANCVDGMQPVGVTFAADGTLYGTTGAGGKNGAGTVFRINGAGALVALHDFCSAADCSDGIMPGALILATNHNFYGTTAAGGANQAGTVFRMTPRGVVTLLHSFCMEKKCADGEQPTPILAQGSDGYLYGTTVLGGSAGLGTIFRISMGGAFATVHSFCETLYCHDGATPLDGPVAATGGVLYGTTSAGGRFYQGLVFAFAPASGYAVITQFCASRGCFDGAAPNASPVPGRNGLLYGATSGGGDYDAGSVYRLKP